MNLFRMPFSSAAAIVVLVSSVVQAGILMVNVEESYVEPESKSTTKIYVDKDRMRVDTKGDEVDQAIIFHKDKETFWMIDFKKGTFTEITKKDLQGLTQQMEEANKKLQEQMKDMPAEQRKMMEDMMKQRMPVGESKVVYKKKAENEKINQWVCDKYEGYLKGEKEEDVWTTDWKKLGLSPDDFKVMEDMEKFFESLSGAKSSPYKIGSEDWEKEQGYPGIPIRTLTYSEGKAQEKTELWEIRKQDFESALFELPPGLKKDKMPWGDKKR